MEMEMTIIITDENAFDQSMATHKEINQIKRWTDKEGNDVVTLQFHHIMTAYHFGRYIQLCEVQNKARADQKG